MIRNIRVIVIKVVYNIQNKSFSKKKKKEENTVFPQQSQRGRFSLEASVRISLKLSLFFF